MAVHTTIRVDKEEHCSPVEEFLRFKVQGNPGAYFNLRVLISLKSPLKLDSNILGLKADYN